MKEYVLGLDLGANSIGWAMVSTIPEPNSENIISGVRVFPEGTENVKGQEQSRNKTRREARQARRQHDRRSRRKLKLRHILVKNGLFPQNPEEQKVLWMMNPYDLRLKGLDNELSEYEFARCLLHINQRRGFKSSLKGNAEAKKEASKTVEPAINKLCKEMQNTKSRTLGEYFANLNKDNIRVREHYTRRDMFENEFNILWEKQSKFKPSIWTDELKSEVHHAIFYQRPLKSQQHLIGKCRLEPNEPRCPAASWFAQQFRILQEVNNLRIAGRNSRPLTEEERLKLVNKLMNVKSLKIDDIKSKILQLSEGEWLTFERSERKEIKGNHIESGLKKIFGNNYETLAPALRDEVYESLINDEDEVFNQKAHDIWHLTDEQIKAIANIDQPQGYMRFSLKAIKKIIPHLEQGKELFQSIEDAGYKNPDNPHLDYLPPIHTYDFRNPVVVRALSETRKVVNTLLREYGKPSLIRVELARETKGTIHSRAERTKENREREKYHIQISGILQEHGIPANHDNIEKYKLWEECNHQCPYTGQPIAFPHQLYGDYCEFDVEHIWPYSLTYDNSFMNKTLCARSENNRKHNRTPREAYNAEEYQRILNRIKNFTKEKKRRFYEDIPADFSERQLRDSSYISTEVVKYLNCLGVKVETTRGSITSELRHYWGLNSILNPLGEEVKSRDDHRHHAIDAVVIAVTNRQHIRNLSTFFDFGGRRDFPPPWDGWSREDFRQAVKNAVEIINVSYRPEHKISGQINQETNYGLITDGKYVHRVKLTEIKTNQIERIIDKKTRKLVKERFESCGQNAKLAFDPVNNPLYLPTRKTSKRNSPIIKTVRIYEKADHPLIAIKDSQGNPYRYVETGENHHISIFEWQENGRIKRDAIVTTRFEVLQRVQRNRKHRKLGEPLESVIQRTHPEHPEARFVTYLCKKDMFLLEDQTADGLAIQILARVQKFSVTNTIILYIHNYAGPCSDYDKPPIIIRKSPSTLKGKKVIVDPIGRIREAHD